MMGHRQVEQAALFYEFSLERHIPLDHCCGRIYMVVALGPVLDGVRRSAKTLLQPELGGRRLIPNL